MKRAIVIGATSGIGRSLANLLVNDGYKVGIAGRRIQLLEELKAENPTNYFVKYFDSTDTDTIPAGLTELTSLLGGLDLLIISAGIGDLNETLDFEIEKRTIDTNVSGFTAIADWAFNYFKHHKSGHLLGISSVAGLRGSRHATAYSASKAYQINYLEGLRQKAKKTAFPIIVTDIRPGFVDTPMAKGDGLFWVASPEKAAKQIIKAIKAKRNVVYITKRWRFVACLMKLIPEWLFLRM